MTSEINESFPQTRQDISNLKQTAVDAAKDIGSTATVHAKKAQSNLKELASHAKEESGDHLNQVKSGFADLADQFRDYVVERPLATVGTALAIGFVLGFLRRGSRS
jgi:ElaB/YqjD/DUF883 family membrane-anchored ribosome-binding protein